jgi:NADH dehydrogenase [ubiquinone] 1 alpha subcomplex assembly factor 7
MMERLDAFMARANAAYYSARDPFADFTTGPEISQVFGELLGAWAAVTWQAMGAPDPVILAEAGPGRGTLMADALRAIRQTAPAFARALRLHLVETSPRLRALAAVRLPEAVWHARMEDLPDGPLLLLANEFLDALPIRQFVRRAGGWAERFVADGAFVEVPARPPGSLAAPGTGAGSELAEGAVLEICEPARALVGHLGTRLARGGGAALFLDYGPERSAPGESLQALRGRRPADPLAEPGEADLTAHVDFAALAAEARGTGAVAWGPVPQGIFLVRLGLFQRTGQLARANPARAAGLMAAARRLAEPDRMGRLFKALAIAHPGLPAPAGFAA